MNDLLKKLKDLYRTPTALELAVRELTEAERESLAAQRMRDYYAAMMDYNDQRIFTLKKYIRDKSEEQSISGV